MSSAHAAAGSLTRRAVLKLGGAALAGAGIQVAGPSPASAQAPRRGGTFRVCLHIDTVHLDPQLTTAVSTMIPLSLSHSRLVKVRAGAGVRPNSLPLEPDVAESWSQPNDTTYLFKLRKGVRWHNKPPVNGRELTADDVKYSFERYLTLAGNPNRGTLEQIDRVDAVDRHTVRITLKEPQAWFLDKLASTSTWLVAREAVEKFGDLKRPEACIGTGPWVLDRFEPSVRLSYSRNPQYFVPGLPYVDAVEMTVDTDPSSRLAAWLSGKYDFAPEYGMVVRRLDLDVARQRKPGLQTAEFIVGFGGITWMKLDREPFKDVRVRRALAQASSWREILETNAWSLGHGVPNPAVPAALREWSIPIDQLGDARKLYDQNTAEARRLLAEAGYPQGFKTTAETTAGYGPDYIDAVQIALKNWKAAGVEVELKLKEYGAFLATTLLGKFDRMALGLFGAWTDPDSYLYRLHIPGQITNAGGVNDPKLTDMIGLQRRTFDAGKRRDILYDIQRYLAQQAYYLYAPSVTALAGWDAHVRNFAPNIGHDYGGRLMVAWLDK